MPLIPKIPQDYLLNRKDKKRRLAYLERDLPHIKDHLMKFNGVIEHQYGTNPIKQAMLIKEHNQWRLYGNQQ